MVSKIGIVISFVNLVVFCIRISNLLLINNLIIVKYIFVILVNRFLYVWLNIIYIYEGYVCNVDMIFW